MLNPTGPGKGGNMQLAEVTTEEVAKYLEKRKLVLVPMGSLEQHWKAAPLGCDTIIPVKLCAEVGDRTGAAVAPAIPYGMSEHHMEFAGTVSLAPETLELVVADVLESLYVHGFRRMVLLSGHGGNGPSAERAIRRVCSRRGGLDARYLLYRNLPGAVSRQKELFCPDPGYHVTVTEVSMIWYLLDREIPDFPRIKFPPEPSRGEVRGRREWKLRYPDGGAGSDLRYVSTEKGAEFFRFLVESFCDYLDEMEGN